MKLKEIIKEMKLEPDVIVFIHIYGKNEEDKPVMIKDIEKSLLNKTVRVVFPNCGGIDYNYGCYKFILR